MVRSLHIAGPGAENYVQDNCFVPLRLTVRYAQNTEAAGNANRSVAALPSGDQLIKCLGKNVVNASKN